MDGTIPLGAKVRDPISGLEGVVTGRHEYLHGCVRLSVQPYGLDKDGKPHDPASFDEPALDVLATPDPGSNRPPPTGGPRDDPARPALPSRR
jgi:hypothetical protein